MDVTLTALGKKKKLKNNLRFYLFLDRVEGREKEREISMCGCLLNASHQGPCPQLRHVP